MVVNLVFMLEMVTFAAQILMKKREAYEEFKV